MRFLSGFSKVGFVENYGLIELLVEMVSFPYQHIFSGFKMTLLPSTHAISVSTIAITLTWRHISLLNRIFLPGSGNYRIYIIFNGYSVMHVKIICRIRFEKNWKKKIVKVKKKIEFYYAKICQKHAVKWIFKKRFW